MSEPKILELEKEIEKNRVNMTIYTNAEQSYSHTGENKYLQEPLRFQASRGNPNDKFTFEKNGIKIGKGINHINVKGTVSVLHKESDGRNAFIYIRKNGIKMTEIQHRLQNMNEAYNMFTFYNYMEVKEGDLIQLYIALDNANFTIKGLSKISATQLSVEVVD